MHRITIFFLFFIYSICLVYSQDSAKVEKLDIIYLKNGKTIKGKLVKRQFGTISVKITDSISQKENIVIYQQKDVKKIEEDLGKADGGLSKADLQSYIEGSPNSKRKGRSQSMTGGVVGMPSNPTQSLTPEQSPHEDILRQVQQPGGNISMPVMVDQPVIIDGARATSPDEYFDPFSVPRPKRREKIWNREIKGFRAFLDYVSYVQGIGNEKNHRLESGGSIGFQFNPIFYVGMGLSYSLTLNNKDESLPVFLNPRINFLDNNTTPFWDVRVGYSVAQGKGFYFSTAFGVSFAKKGKSAWNLGLVYSIQNAKYYDWSETAPKERVAFKPTYHGLGLRLTYEFGIGR